MAEAAREFNTSLSYDWIVKDRLKTFSHPPSQSVLQEVWEKLAGEPVTEASEGWCEVPGCKTQFVYWMVAMGILSILGSTSRVGNVLVALRCVDISDKSLSFAIQVGNISLFIFSSFYFPARWLLCLCWQCCPLL